MVEKIRSLSRYSTDSTLLHVEKCTIINFDSVLKYLVLFVCDFPTAIDSSSLQYAND